ncbi:NAD-dependent epimerase/dehydratase family protein [Cohaesibacter haloalkalitolerans]|uniref:NAD-dependent epimerase/dehydratase family protein n=1 Tax=Cohaesibacter haloalkalitolerans TaxID=1162980 RepID=UPI000E64B5D3|nr:NAD(P)-dependent oxidoreductase [Cohaesibacter haloalkalitolerans]
MRRILLTGAAGMVGTVLADLVPREGEVWRLSDMRPIERPDSEAFEVVMGDLSDPDFAMALCTDVDAIIHMAAVAREKDWDELIGPNLVGSINLWQAAVANRVDRIIYGSSNHAQGMYPVGMTVRTGDGYRPDSRYGLTKMFGEGLARLHADKNGVKAFVIRIGSFLPRPTSERHLRMWISHRDMGALVRLGLEADYHCETVFGISANGRACYDNSRAHALGYRPQDNAEAYADEIAREAVDPANPVEVLQGGHACGRDFTGSLARLLEDILPERS